MKIDDFKFTVSEGEIALNFNDGQTRTYKFDKVTPKVAKTIEIASGVTVDGDFLFVRNERINIADIDAVFDSGFSTYLLTGNERKYITITLNAIDGEMAKRIAKYCPHLTEFNDNVFIVKNKITAFLVDVKSNSKRTKNDFSSYSVGAVVGNFFVPVSWEKDFDDAVIKCYDLEIQQAVAFDNAPLPDKDGIISADNSKIDLTAAKAIYADEYCNVMITDVHGEGYKIHTFSDALTARRYIQMSAKFNPNMAEIVNNVYVDKSSINYFYVDNTPTDYKVVMVFNRDCRLSLNHFQNSFDAFKSKNKLNKLWN